MALSLTQIYNMIFQIGTIEKPAELAKLNPVESGGIGQLLTLATQTIVVIAGLFTLFNLLLAGYAFLSAGNDPKKIQDAWAKIWQSILGLTITAGAFTIAVIVGYLLYGNASAILAPTIPTIP